jgi:protoporphyrinogen IX oxidase
VATAKYGAAWTRVGVLLAAPEGINDVLHQGWLHVKLLCVILMSAVHGLYARWRKIFERDGNTRTANFYRFWNEVPAILLLIIVAMAVAKPY